MENEEPAENTEKGSTTICGGLGIRHLQILLQFFGMVIGYCLRVSMSVAIVAMTQNDQSTDHAFEVYDWKSTEQSLILSSFFWGYTIMQIPSGYIATVWSAQKLLSVGVLLCGIINILTPTVAHYGSYIGVCICRVGMGLCQSCLLPCIQTLLSKWAPPSERARLGTLAYAGAQFGTVICFPISGELAASSVGWPSIFYTFGVLTIIWAIVFFIFGSDSPSKHSGISEKERRYIEDSLKTPGDKEKSDNKRALKTPWKAIFTSVPMWALIIVHCGQNWGFWTLITELPIYMNNILKFKLEENGWISALPYLTMWILSFPTCWLADYALKKNISREVIRKVCNSIAHWGPAIALICLGTISMHDATVATTILVIAVGLNAGSLSGYQINHIDISPNFAGTLMSITNCIASIIAIIAPIVCGIITKDEKDVTQWNIVFYLSAAIYILGNLMFVIFGSTEIQPWNNPKTTNIKEQSEKELTVI
ncbi:putative inorganic phosphate cotransporter isoform X2 [Bombus affinis]|uniref:putative inorganic phosphate cotransporter isoform X2 n=1 Tax=Bombus affinis TaxID=309941 RepID=UPI0021B7F4F0|nr:putative inorganic phosphate cotransporter isoform X2 [Bombus affinis]